MRKLAVRSAAGTAVLAALIGLGTAADPPLVLPTPKPLEEPRRLRTEMEGLAADREAASKELTDAPNSSAERAKLRAQLLDLIKKVGEKKTAPPAVPMPPATISPGVVKEPLPSSLVPKFLPGEDSRPTDSLRAAQNYFRADDVDAALYTLNLLRSETTPLSREDRAFVLYLTACCYRKKNQPTEAMKLYREVADARDDDFLAERAVWQLSTMKSIQELETNLEQLRSRRKSK